VSFYQFLCFGNSQAAVVKKEGGNGQVFRAGLGLAWRLPLAGSGACRTHRLRGSYLGGSNRFT